MKSISKLFKAAALAILGSLALSTEAEAKDATACYIHFNRPCVAAGTNLAYRPHQYFKDGDLIATVNLGRCIQRAMEYKAWCANPGQDLEVVAAFQINGRNHAYGATYQGTTYLYNEVWKYTGFAK